MAQSMFGAGFLFAVPLVSYSTPVMFGALQDVSIDISFDMKMLYGSQQFALEQARGKGKCDIKATMGRVDPSLFNNVFFGQPTSVGMIRSTAAAGGEVGTVGMAGTVTVANGATYRTDLGVYNPALGGFYQRVTGSSPTVGQYTINTTTGLYLFNSSESGVSFRFYYTYGDATGGTTISATNQVMGSGPPNIQLHLPMQYKGKPAAIIFNSVQASKLSLPMKLDDFTLPQIQMSAQDDGYGGLFTVAIQG